MSCITFFYHSKALSEVYLSLLPVPYIVTLMLLKSKYLVIYVVILSLCRTLEYYGCA